MYKLSFTSVDNIKNIIMNRACDAHSDAKLTTVTETMALHWKMTRQIDWAFPRHCNIGRDWERE